jgi:serine/threonine protein kinase
MVQECSLLAQCGACDAIVDTYGWGMVQLVSPDPQHHQQQQQQEAAPSSASASAAAAGGSSSSAPPSGLAIPVMLLEYAPHGTLANQVSQCPGDTGLSAAAAAAYMRRVLEALECLHGTHSTVHRDLKAANCLLMEPDAPVDAIPMEERVYRLKVADLGIAKALTQPGAPSSDTVVYTPTHRAPEQTPGKQHTFNLDLWQLGCLLLEARSKRPPFDHIDRAPGLSKQQKDQRRGAADLKSKDSPYSRLLTKEEVEFATACLEVDTSKRKHPMQMLKHPYFRQGD